MWGRLLCALGLHYWSGWVVRQQGRLMEKGAPVGYYIRQSRACERCDLITMREIDSI